MEKIEFDNVLGRNPLEEDLDSIWNIPKKKKKLVEEDKGIAVKEEAEIRHGEPVEPAPEPAEAVETIEPVEIQTEIKPSFEQSAEEKIIPVSEFVEEAKHEVLLPEIKEQGVAAQEAQVIKAIEEKEDEKGIEKAIQMVGLKLEHEFYGIDIMQVQEIIRMHEITMVPRTPHFVKGVVNLRGKVVPIISLRERFGIKEIESTKETRIVIVKIDVGVMGFIVDAVSEVIRIPERLIEPPPATATSIETEYIKGVGKLEDRLLIVLDLNKVLTREKKEFLNF